MIKTTSNKRKLIKLFRGTKFLGRLFLTILTIFVFWLSGFIYFINQLPKQNPIMEMKADGIVVLTGGSNRLITSIELLAEGKAKRLLITGVGERADLDTLLILSGGILPDNISDLIKRIDLGYKAKDTKGNASEAAAWVKENNYSSIILVTSFYHIPRSLNEFKHSIPEVEVNVYAVLPQQLDIDNWWHDLRVFNFLVFEYSKYLASLVRLV